MEQLIVDTDRGPFNPEEHELLLRTVRKLKTSRLRLPDVQDMDSGDLVDYFNTLVLVNDVDCLDSPTWVNWDITRRCNCSCIHCAADAVFDPDNSGTDETPTARALDFIDEMASAGVLTVVLSGGEPFMRPDLYTILERIKRNRMFVTILTNGSIPIDVERLSDILDPDADLVQISLDGADAESHDHQRNAQIFNKTVRTIRLLVDAALPVKANMVLTDLNIDKIYDVFHFARQLGVPTISFTVNCPVGRGQSIPIFDSQRLLRISMNLYRLSELYPEIKIRNSVLLLPYSIPQIRELVRPDRSRLFPRYRCLAGTAKTVVDSIGNMYPCPFLLYPAFNAGNVFRRGLYALWHNPNTWPQLRKGRRLEGTKCGDCDFLNRCRGECPGAAYGVHKTIHAPDPRCTYEQEVA